MIHHRLTGCVQKSRAGDMQLRTRRYQTRSAPGRTRLNLLYVKRL